MTVPADARRQVIQRAEDSCEYCGLSQAGQEALFHVDHVIPVTAGGTATLDNLAPLEILFHRLGWPASLARCAKARAGKHWIPRLANRCHCFTHAEKVGDDISSGMAFAFLA